MHRRNGGVVAPFVDWTKRDIIEYSRSEGLDLNLTYSCEAEACRHVVSVCHAATEGRFCAKRRSSNQCWREGDPQNPDSGSVVFQQSAGREKVKDLLRFAEELITDENPRKRVRHPLQRRFAKVKISLACFLDSGGYEASGDQDLSDLCP